MPLVLSPAKQREEVLLDGLSLASVSSHTFSRQYSAEYLRWGFSADLQDSLLEVLLCAV